MEPLPAAAASDRSLGNTCKGTAGAVRAVIQEPPGGDDTDPILSDRRGVTLDVLLWVRDQRSHQNRFLLMGTPALTRTWCRPDPHGPR